MDPTTALTGDTARSALERLIDAAASPGTGFAAMLLIVAILLLTSGSRIARAAIGASGLVLGLLAGLVLFHNPSTSIVESDAVGLLASGPADPPWLAMLLGAGVGCVVAVVLYRAACVVGASGAVAAAALVLAGLSLEVAPPSDAEVRTAGLITEAAPDALTDPASNWATSHADRAGASRPEFESERPERESPSIDLSRGYETAVVDYARARALDEGASMLEGASHHPVSLARSLSPGARARLVILAAGGAVIGLALGVLSARRSSALVTSAIGAALTLVAGATLLESRGLSAPFTDGWLIPGVAWLALTVVGAWMQREKPAAKAVAA
ncbi:MAG: hypothetical protein RBS39_01695 [Phycisphaerales bacterium]|jgi:hypothetical protein|nr:hypothetical protein [Phycisphaerales bacterium]